MSTRQHRKLESTAASLHQRYGAQALRKASNLAGQVIPPHASTGFPALDAITGCQGVPLGEITLFSGRTTSGKLTLAYKTLMNAQRPARNGKQALVAIVDLTRSTDPDYLSRAGVDLEHALIARPNHGQEAVELLLDLARTQHLRAVLVDNLADLLAPRGAGRRLQAALSQLRYLLRSAKCALIFVDEPSPPWQRWFNLDRSTIVREHAALHIEMERESWLIHQQRMAGYCARVRILKSRWARGFPSAPVDIRFNGAIVARQTW
jgi:recombination protein RecA